MKWANIKPVPKVNTAALAGAIATVGWWAGEVYGEVSAPAAVIAASVVILTAVVGWLTPTFSHEAQATWRAIDNQLDEEGDTISISITNPEGENV